ncbi:glycosyltransferase family 2 protein [Pleomorphovibrio marinus]|uniref:glycosyltransferase family 2 protein n=1 Tax=Pleomorphovibrio marinus TaxID=2164132 RepID=UPI000E0C8417|nr:glycosyltransferase family A protein [Pleomorphovibrio marinus]
MTVSVIVTTYNRPYLCHEAVKSVLSQRQPPDEIVVVNDGESFDLLGFERKNGIVLNFLQNENSIGSNPSRHKGANASFGDILMFLDDDDTWEPDKIKSQVNHFKNKKIGLVYSGKLIVSSNNRDKVLYKVPANFSGDASIKILKENFIGSTSSVAIRRNVYFESGGFDPELPAIQDYDLWIRACQITEIKADGGFNLRYTQHLSEGQISKDPKKKIESIKIIEKKYKRYFEKLNYLDNRKRRSKYFFNISKIYKLNENKLYLKYLWKSIFLFPSPKYFSLFFPIDFIYKLTGR